MGDGKDVVRMCIDATHFSNLGRFLNHSCDPNCYKQRILCDHMSRLPRIAFFTLRDIQPLEELTYDYGYADVPGKTVPCCAARGTASCFIRGLLRECRDVGVIGTVLCGLWVVCGAGWRSVGCGSDSFPHMSTALSYPHLKLPFCRRPI